MIDSINNHPKLKAFIRKKCAEIKGGQRPSEIKLNRNIDPKLITVIKIDDYYISLRKQKTPKSVDCLIVFETVKGYKLFLIELKEPKNYSRLSNIIRPSEMEKKFRTSVNDFLKKRFADIFLSQDFQILDYRLFVVSSLLKSIREAFKKKGLNGLKCEKYLTIKPFRFRNLTRMIMLANSSDFEEIIQ